MAEGCPCSHRALWLPRTLSPSVLTLQQDQIQSSDKIICSFLDGRTFQQPTQLPSSPAREMFHSVTVYPQILILVKNQHPSFSIGSRYICCLVYLKIHVNDLCSSYSLIPMSLVLGKQGLSPGSGKVKPSQLQRPHIPEPHCPPGPAFWAQAPLPPPPSLQAQLQGRGGRR